MSDMRLNMTNNIAPDTKNRNLMDAVAAEMSNSQFLDVMMTRIASMDSDDAELKALVNKVDRNKGTDAADNKALLNRLQDLQKREAAERADAVMKKEDVKKKIKDRVRDITENHTAPVKDTKALKALQKTAKALVEANEKGEITLPDAMVQKLNDFLAKGDDFKAFDIASFMGEFNELFRGVVIAMPQNGQETSSGFVWPQDVVDAFDAAGLGHIINSNSNSNNSDNTDMMAMMRALKALVNESRNAANDTLDAVAKAAVDGDAAADLAATIPAAASVASKETAAQPVPAEAAVAKQAAPVKAEASDMSLTASAKDAAFPKQDEQGNADTSSEGDNPRQPRAEAQAKQASAAPSLAADVKAAMTAQAAAPQAAQPAAAAATIAVDPTLVGVDQGGVSAPAAARAAFAAEIAAADRAKPSLPAQQVMVQIQQRASGNKPTQISVQLSPAELGRVEVRLTIQRDGQAHAVVVADKPETLAMLQKDASHLERALQQAGVNTDAGSMSFNLRDQQPEQDFAGNRKRFNRQAIGDVAAQEAQLHILPESIISDTRINYHA